MKNSILAAMALVCLYFPSQHAFAGPDAVMINHRIMHTACQPDNRLKEELSGSEMPGVRCTFKIGEKLRIVKKVTKDFWKLAPYDLENHEVTKQNSGYAHISEVVSYRDPNIKPKHEEGKLLILSF